jgi:UDP-galactopyranose mutase
MISKNFFDVVVVGAGISGCVLAERYANLSDKKVLIIDKRDHIGGNCYDYFDESGILVSKYGPHYFHTNDEDVFKYVSAFTEWIPYEHKVVGHVDGLKVPVPVNIKTVNDLFGLDMKTEKEMISWLEQNTEHIEAPMNSEESALNRVGRVLYEKIFENYTVKQWDKHPTELDPEIMNRIPVRTSFEDRYFTDKYQFMPKDGYTKIFERMLNNKNIKIKLNTDWNGSKNEIKYKKLFFTGRIDSYFDEKIGKLEYRSLRFEFETLNQEHFQEYSQENYPSSKYKFTRIVEYKNATGQKHKKTTISREYPTWEGEPYYPVFSKNNKDIYQRYKEKARTLEKKGIYFVGRLANYKYFNMDQAFKNALSLFDKLENK